MSKSFLDFWRHLVIILLSAKERLYKGMAVYAAFERFDYYRGTKQS